MGLGGEWGGAVLLATENAPSGKRAWYGMFPQLGAPLGFFISAGLYLVLTKTMNNHVFLVWGWRIPFLSSAFLVCVGLWVRWHIAETPSFARVVENHRRVRIPLLTVATTYRRALCLGTLTGFATFVLGYTSTVFVLSWGTSHLGYSRDAFLKMQLIVTGFYALGILVSAACADRYGKPLTMIVACVSIFLLGFFFVPLFATIHTGKVLLFLALTQAIMGLTYGPLSTVLADMFPAEARYTGASLVFNLAGILGAALAPNISIWLTERHGLASMGCYLSAAAVVSLGAFLASTSRSKVAT